MVIEEPKKAGRPPRLSREMILTAAMELIESENISKLSIRRIAQSLGTAPGNLYTYFPDKQALLDALGEQVFADFRVELNVELPWNQQIEAWMEQVHDRLLKNQDLVFLMGVAGTTPQSLATMKAIAALLQDQGVDDKQAVLHAQGLLWNVMSFSVFEYQASDQKIIDQFKASGQESVYPEITQHLAIENLTPLWKVNLQRNLDGIRYQVNQYSS